MSKRNKRKNKINKSEQIGEIIELREKRERKDGKDKRNIWIREIQPKNEKQRLYIETVNNKDVTFCIGPAGTGKTYLACKIAADFLISGKVKSIVLCRPVVEAGEKLGYLPGNLEEKLNPYLRPLYDALSVIMTHSIINEMIENKTIEVLPLAYMRGRTLSNSFVILDEAQNTSPEQMKMFLTRMGDGSKFLVNGDVTQNDLCGKLSGLVDAKNKINNINEIGWIEFGREDIVRHPTVQKIVECYEK